MRVKTAAPGLIILTANYFSGCGRAAGRVRSRSVINSYSSASISPTSVSQPTCLQFQLGACSYKSLSICGCTEWKLPCFAMHWVSTVGAMRFAGNAFLATPHLTFSVSPSRKHCDDSWFPFERRRADSSTIRDPLEPHVINALFPLWRVTQIKSYRRLLTFTLNGLRRLYERLHQFSFGVNVWQTTWLELCYLSAWRGELLFRRRSSYTFVRGVHMRARGCIVHKMAEIRNSPIDYRPPARMGTCEASLSCTEVWRYFRVFFQYRKLSAAHSLAWFDRRPCSADVYCWFGVRDHTHRRSSHACGWSATHRRQYRRVPAGSRRLAVV